MIDGDTWDVFNPRAPYDQNGNLLAYPAGYYSWNGGIQWLDADPFFDTLTLSHFSRGRSSAQFHWKRPDGRQYPMFMKDMEELLFHSKVDQGVTPYHFWQVTKRGANYGIKLAHGPYAGEVFEYGVPAKLIKGRSQ